MDIPAATHIETGSQIQAKTTDPEFTRVLTEGWRHLLAQPHVNKDRVAVCGYCMGGRIAIHFVAATPEVRAFVGYYPTVRDEPETSAATSASYGCRAQDSLPVDQSLWRR